MLGVRPELAPQTSRLKDGRQTPGRQIAGPASLFFGAGFAATLLGMNLPPSERPAVPGIAATAPAAPSTIGATDTSRATSATAATAATTPTTATAATGATGAAGATQPREANEAKLLPSPGGSQATPGDAVDPARALTFDEAPELSAHLTPPDAHTVLRELAQTLQLDPSVDNRVNAVAQLRTLAHQGYEPSLVRNSLRLAAADENTAVADRAQDAYDELIQREDSPAEVDSATNPP
jgi:hypothetical protein